VIYDELDLALGTFKIRERGSPAATTEPAA